MPRLLDRWWWWFLFKSHSHSGYGFWRNFWCNFRGHHGPVWWFNTGGQEPDMRCQDCGEDLG